MGQPVRLFLILLTLSINACYRIYKSEFLHPQKEVCANLYALKKEPQKSQKCALKKGEVRSLFTQPRAPAYRVHKLSL